MSTVINLPQGQSLGGSIGNTLGSIIAQQGAATIAAMEAARFQKIQNSIASAPDRNTAVAIATQLPFKNMQEFEHTMKYLDQYHPQSEAATVDFKSYDDRGNEVTTAMSRKDTRRFGPQTKQKQEEVYQLNPTTGKYESYGMNVAGNIESNQTTPGASALDNMAMDNKRADAAALKTSNDDSRLQAKDAFQMELQASNAYNTRLINALGGSTQFDPTSGSISMVPGSIPYDKLGAYRDGTFKAGKLLKESNYDAGKALEKFFAGNKVATDLATPPPEPPPVPKPVPKESFWKHPIDNTIKALTPDAKVPENKTPVPAPQLQKAPATADFPELRAAIKGVPLRVEPNPPEDPHNPTIFYPKTAADMGSIPEGGTYLNPKDGLHYVKTASVAPPVVENIQTSGSKGEVAPNLKGGKETGQLLGPIDIEKEIKIAPGILSPAGKIKDMDKAVREVERLRAVVDRVYEQDKVRDGGLVSDDYKKAVKALHSLTTPMGEDAQGSTPSVIKDVKPSPTVIVGPPLGVQKNGDPYVLDIPTDGKFYQNVIYRDGYDRFMVDAQGNRISVDDIFNKKGK